jgi:hypothetical protein
MFREYLGGRNLEKSVRMSDLTCVVGIGSQTGERGEVWSGIGGVDPIGESER